MKSENEKEATRPEMPLGERTLAHACDEVNVRDALSHTPALFDGATDMSVNSITLDIAQVLEYRTNLLNSHCSDNWLEGEKLAILFEIGKSCRGMEFRHEW